MSYQRIKGITKSLGVYRAARWVHRHVMNRGELQTLREESALYGQFVGPGDLCFDVGANYGGKSEVFLRLGARVVAFEPQPDCASELVARIGHHPRLTLVKSALGSESGQAKLFVHEDRACSSFLADWEGPKQSSITVPVTTLHEAIAQFGIPRYLKIDVEGFEVEVLKGLRQPIETVSFEYHLNDDAIEKAVSCLEILRGFGPITCNLYGAYCSTLSREEWWPFDEFVLLLRNKLSGQDGCGYGDIFVRSTQ